MAFDPKAYAKEYYKRRKAEDPTWRRRAQKELRKRRRERSPEETEKRYKQGWQRRLAKKVELAGRPRPEKCELCDRTGVISWDHCHTMGSFRGWLCRSCNTALGLMQENPIWLRKLADYVETHSCLPA